MPKAAVLHIGFHKTGTSTVQQMLRQNRPALKQFMALRLKPQMKDLLHAARGFSTWRDPLSLAKVERRFARLVDDLPGMPRRTLCLSAEELAGHMPGRDSLSDYSAAPILAQTFAQVLQNRFPDAIVHFVISLRAPETWLRSAWAEHVKSSSLTLDFEDFTQKYPHAARFMPMVEQVQKIKTARTHAYFIEDMRDTPAKPILDLCQVPEDVQAQLDPSAAVNTRLPHDVLLELLAANRAYADRDARTAAKQAILAQVQT